MINEEIIIINDEPFYRILNGTSYDYAPIPKEFKPYFERLQKENQKLKEEIEGNKRVEEYSKGLILTLQDRIEKALSIIKEKVKDDYGIIDTGVVWEIENILKGVKNE